MVISAKNGCIYGSNDKAKRRVSGGSNRGDGHGHSPAYKLSMLISQACRALRKHELPIDNSPSCVARWIGDAYAAIFECKPHGTGDIFFANHSIFLAYHNGMTLIPRRNHTVYVEPSVEQ